jgi:DNA-binding HxlR family transcriptional regulator
MNKLSDYPQGGQSQPMPRASFARMNCAIARTLDLIGERWTLLILRNAFCGMTRFDAFSDHLGIPSNVLAARLRKLVRGGILTRRPSPSDRRSFDYRLSAKGLDLYPIVIALADWGETWAANPSGPRIRFLDKATGRPLPKLAVRNERGEPLLPSDVLALPGPGADAKIGQLLSRSGGFRSR